MLADRDAAVELANAGLWDQCSDGWRFHDWAEYQPTREQVLAERAAATERKRRSREKSRRDADGTDGGSHPSPSRPVPTRPKDSSKRSKSQSLDNRARVSTDSFIPSEMTVRLASQAGIDLLGVAELAAQWCDRLITPEVALQVGKNILGKAKRYPNNPMSYVASAFEKSPLEQQQFIDRDAA